MSVAGYLFIKSPWSRDFHRGVATASAVIVSPDEETPLRFSALFGNPPTFIMKILQSPWCSEVEEEGVAAERREAASQNLRLDTLLSPPCRLGGFYVKNEAAEVTGIASEELQHGWEQICVDRRSGRDFSENLPWSRPTRQACFERERLDTRARAPDDDDLDREISGARQPSERDLLVVISEEIAEDLKEMVARASRSDVAAREDPDRAVFDVIVPLAKREMSGM